jgi:magnesium-transporting ATPase (P-type)
MSRLEENIDELQRSLDQEKRNICSKENCFPMMLIFGVLAPIIIWIILYFFQPRFVQETEGTRRVRSNTKVFYWTVIFTLLIWVAMYLWTWCRGFNKVSLLCART